MRSLVSGLPFHALPEPERLAGELQNVRLVSEPVQERSEFLGEAPSGHFMRRGETSPFVSKFLR